MNNLAASYNFLKDMQNSIKTYEKSLKILEKKVGSNHPAV